MNEIPAKRRNISIVVKRLLAVQRLIAQNPRKIKSPAPDGDLLAARGNFIHALSVFRVDAGFSCSPIAMEAFFLSFLPFPISISSNVQAEKCAGMNEVPPSVGSDESRSSIWEGVKISFEGMSNFHFFLFGLFDYFSSW